MNSPRAYFRNAWKDSALVRKYLWNNRKLVFWGMLTLILVDLLEIVPPLLLKRAIDHLSLPSQFQVIAECAILYFAVFFFQGLGRYGWRMFLIRSSYLSGRDLRHEFVNHLFKLPPAFYDKNRVGDLMSLSNGDVESVRQYLGPGILTLADSLFYLLSVPVAMALLSPKLTLIVLLPLPLIPIVVMAYEKRIHLRYKASQNHFSEISSMAQESLNGIRVVKAFAQESKQESRFRKLGETYIELNLKLARTQSSFGPLMDFFTSLGLVALIWWGGLEVIDGSVSLGTLVAFQRYMQKMVWPMIAVGFSMSMYQRAKASSERLTDVLIRQSEITEKSPALGRTRKQNPDPREIRIQNLSFAYPSNPERMVLKNVSLQVEKGMRVALMGGVGSGKTTLLQLLPRLYQAPEKTIHVGGSFIEDWNLQELRKSFGMVTQDVFLFSDTLEKNISFREPHLAANHRTEKVIQRVKEAEFSQDLQHLENGLLTVLGERGVTLSGGQKQRVSIARALFDQPPVLLFDDALSAVDVKTESRLLASLRQHLGGSTLLYSAHRLSSVRDADLIAVLHQGELVQQGTHTQLLKERSGPYFRFYEQQRIEEELEASIRDFEKKGES
jgi:ATP-binding cassette, subfamily B, multidrug efflux pump